MHKHHLSSWRRNRKAASSFRIAARVDTQARAPRQRRVLVWVPAAKTLRLWPLGLGKRGASPGLGGASRILAAGIVACALTIDACAQSASKDLADKLTPAQL